jgi:hypothetical protein
MSVLTKSAEEKIRLNLDLSLRVKNQLDELRTRTDAPSLSEVIRRSVACYDLLTEHCGEGGALVLRHPDGTEETLVLLEARS